METRQSQNQPYSTPPSQGYITLYTRWPDEPSYSCSWLPACIPTKRHGRITLWGTR